MINATEALLPCFNSQPPEGGWHMINATEALLPCFNSQPPEGGWEVNRTVMAAMLVSTHSRPKAAGLDCWACICVLQ